MTDTRRTDIHRPSFIDPAEYEFVDAFYQGTNTYMVEVYDRDTNPNQNLSRIIGVNGAKVKDFLLDDGNFAWMSTCDHCGAAFAHGTYWLHRPTSSVIAVGHICAANTMSVPDRAALVRKRAESAARTGRERAKVAEQAAAWKAEHPKVIAHLEEFAATNHFYADLIRKLGLYGSLTDRQTAAVERNMDKDIEHRDQRAKWDEQKVAIPAFLLDGRHEVEGRLVSIKKTYNQFGPVTKMLLADDRGFKLWGTLPRAIIDDAKVGDRIRFTATISVSDDDDSFGFTNRPSRAFVTAKADTTNDSDATKETA